MPQEDGKKTLEYRNDGEDRPHWRPRYLKLAICAALVAITLAVYWPVQHFGFVNYDDNQYVYENPRVYVGLTWPNIQWAFTTFATSNYHPLTWISYLLDASLFHANPRGMHIENVIFHAANTLLLFTFLCKATANLWPSAMAAAIFAVHPTHVESVAWISERKDVLSMLFLLLSLLSYLQYVNRHHGRHTAAYLATLGFFTLGLLCKAMLVTLPFVLILLDYWPLQRLRSSASSRPCHGEPHQKPGLIDSGLRAPQYMTAPWQPFTLRRAFFEKTPFFILALLASMLTSRAQLAISSSLHAIPLSLRAQNAVLSYAGYLWKSLWPLELAALYPFRWDIPLASVVGDGAVLFLITAGTVVMARAGHRFAIMGWLWFLGTMVPVVGIVQVGAQSMADRYLYLPSIGLGILFVWTSRTITQRINKIVVSFASVALLVALSLLSRRQIGYWVDTDHLFDHASIVLNGPAIAEVRLGFTAEKAGDDAAAERHFRQALAAQPGNYAACFNLGNLLLKNHPDQAIACYQAAASTDPAQSDLHANWGVALMKLHDNHSAFEQLKLAESLDPDAYEPHYNLGQLFLFANDSSHAASEFALALRARPDDVAALHGLKTVRSK